MFILYQQDLLDIPTEEALCRAGRQEELAPYAEELVRGVSSRKEEIDGLLDRHLEEWELGRLGAVERAILRIAVFELMQGRDVPPAVAIDQAVEQAKRYCSDEAGALVNGVLASLLVFLQGPRDRSSGGRTEDK